MVYNTVRHRPTANLRAFTLIELMVVTSIMVIISAVVLASNSRFGGVVQLENLAYDVALSIRQAQVYGISVRRYGAADYTRGYGMHFDTSNATNQAAYEFFVDADLNGLYAVTENIAPSPYSIHGGFKIDHLCAPEGTSAASCSSASQVDIVFKRPEADAWISKNGTSCAYGVGTCMDSVRIVLVSPRGDVMSVLVEANGQISVKREPSL